MSWNVNLHNAKTGKNDEFYTQLIDIEKELQHYKEHFKGKTVFCNCDDPYESNFFKYFAMNFNHLWLKKLIVTWYSTSSIAYTQLWGLFDVRPQAYKIEINEMFDVNQDGCEDLLDVRYFLEHLNSSKNKLVALKGDGDFRSKESLELLEEADIVVTNPPFSLFREYVNVLMKYQKKFLILGNMNAITYKEIFPLIKENKLWTWYGFNMSMVYKTTYPNLLEANRKYVIWKGYNPDDWYVKVPAICWYTNLDINKRHEDLIMYKKYTKDEYPKYETFDAIDVNTVSEIPFDYYWIMWVPKTFIDKYNPNQFELLWYEREDENIQVWIKNMSKSFLDDYRKYWGKWHYTSWMKMLCYYDNNRIPRIPFSRILIRRKK